MIHVIVANNALSQLVIPKSHGAKLTDIPDDELREILVWRILPP
jgi:hypothetical protein